MEEQIQGTQQESPVGEGAPPATETPPTEEVSTPQEQVQVPPSTVPLEEHEKVKSELDATKQQLAEVAERRSNENRIITRLAEDKKTQEQVAQIESKFSQSKDTLYSKAIKGEVADLESELAILNKKKEEELQSLQQNLQAYSKRVGKDTNLLLKILSDKGYDTNNLAASPEVKNVHEAWDKALNDRQSLSDVLELAYKLPPSKSASVSQAQATTTVPKDLESLKAALREEILKEIEAGKKAEAEKRKEAFRVDTAHPATAQDYSGESARALMKEGWDEVDKSRGVT